MVRDLDAPCGAVPERGPMSSCAAMTASIELGLDTFGDVTRAPSGELVAQAQAIRQVVDQGVRADEVGLDFIGVGEHHREDFAVSAPDVVLAAIAARTKRIRMGSAVTVLSSDDPVRVFERFSTLSALSNGRAEIMLGRGSFIESFPLFGYDLNDYERLFNEKLDLFVKLLREDRVTWQGTTRAPLTEQRVHPRLESPLVAWVGVGGTPESVLRAAHFGLPLMLSIIGGPAERFAPLVDLYRRALAQLGKPALPVGLHSPGYVAATDEQARDELFPDYKAMRDRIGAERGWRGSMTRADFDREVEHGALYVGSPDTVARKIVATARLFELARFNLKYSAGHLPHENLLRCIELYGTEVAPRVRELVR
jgi:probable LLM family oxidoreductase